MRSPRRRRQPESPKLHVGAFDVVHDGWLNTDVPPHIAIARVPGLAGLLRRAGRLSDERWAAHRAGVFRRMRYLDLTRALPWRPDEFLDGMLQGRERSRSRHRHWWLYNERSLRELLERTGFADIRRTAYREGRCPDVERIDSRPGSLFMEAQPQDLGLRPTGS